MLRRRSGSSSTHLHQRSCGRGVGRIERMRAFELISADGTVTEAQGYLFSRPVPAVRVRQLLNASHGRRAAEDQVVALPARSIA